MSTDVAAVAGFESSVATVAFIDLAGFSAIADVYGDAWLWRCSASSNRSSTRPWVGPRHLKWIGDEVMLAFDDCPDPALSSALGTPVSRLPG